MKILLRQAKIIDKNSTFNNSVMDVLIENGEIIEIGKSLGVEVDKEIVSNNLHLSVGWMDIGTVATDPGLEHKEDIERLSIVAATGGFTDIAVLPNTQPVTQNKAGINYFKQFAGISATTIHPMAAVTIDCEGKDFTEMMDLYKAGAVAFTDGLHPLWNADILLKTLQYLNPLKALLINRPEEPTMAFMGQMNESIISTMLGLKGIPETAEELMVIRDLKLLEYADIKSDKPVLHFSKISTIATVKLIKEAKAKGLPVSCDVSINQLAFTEENLQTFDSNFKVSPPLRNKKTVKALQKGLEDGTIDLLISDHCPHDEEAKKVAFDEADFGIIGLQTYFSVALKFSNLSLEKLIQKITINPRNLLSLEVPVIKKGTKMPLTVFDPSIVWTFDHTTNVSSASNSPFLNDKMIGKVLAVFNKNKVNIFP